VGLILALLTAIIGEGIAPPADRLAQDIRLGAMGGKVTGQFRSGIWLRDTVRDEVGNTMRQRFVNVAHLSPTGSLRAVRIFEFDTEMRLRSVLSAPNGGFTGVDRWDLKNVSELAIKPGSGAPPTAIRVKRSWLGDHVWTSELTPELISVISIAPDRMSAFDLARYVTHLRVNRQDSTRYELALWKKAIYPIAILVMIALALPFAYMHARAGSIGYKVFAGIMVGVAFHFMNGLFSHIGLLNTWPPWLSVSIPSIVALAIALFMLWRVGGVR
jgi:lipopolysaccharide export system permease protein